jgi:DNA-binding NarL/FixJ family response regulator
MEPRILIVDDHEITREYVRDFIVESRPEFTIYEASNAREAIEITKKVRPDLIIMDFSLPDLNGLQLSARLRLQGLRCPVLVFSNFESKQLSAALRDAGLEGYVAKSGAVPHLLPAIDRLLDGETCFEYEPSNQLIDPHQSMWARQSLGG